MPTSSIVAIVIGGVLVIIMLGIFYSFLKHIQKRPPAQLNFDAIKNETEDDLFGITTNVLHSKGGEGEDKDGEGSENNDSKAASSNDNIVGDSSNGNIVTGRYAGLNL